MSCRVLVLVLVWSLGCWGALSVNSPGNHDWFQLRLVDSQSSGGGGRCSGELQVKTETRSWVRAYSLLMPLWFAHRICEDLGCGPAQSLNYSPALRKKTVTVFTNVCDNRPLVHCFGSERYLLSYRLDLNCSDSVRLVQGQASCSGPLQIRDQSLDRSWTPVCEGALDRQGSEVACRELDCGPPLLQGALSPRDQTFHCEGHESALVDCPRNRTRTCSGPALNLTCSEPLRLVGGASGCQGTLELRSRGQWRRLTTEGRWNLEAANDVCRVLDCGSAVSTAKREFNESDVFHLISDCEKRAPLRNCILNGLTGTGSLDVVCSDSVRLVSGRSLCSGSLQIRDQSLDRSWTPVCEGALDRQGSEVACRELDCGPPLLQGALSPLDRTFYCEGNESALVDCPRNWTSTCSGPALNLTCSEPLRLVGGAGRCDGTLELRYRGQWKPVVNLFDPWDLEAANVVCRDLDCGAVIFAKSPEVSDQKDVWNIKAECVKRSAVRDCVFGGSAEPVYGLKATCSGQ